MKKYDKIIIGGGASGMVAAIESAKAGEQVLLLERMEKLGKKLLATGNGKCNMTNLYWNKKCYRSEQIEFVENTIHRFSPVDTISFFRELGLITMEKNGYVYPNSEQAVSVVAVLSQKLESLAVEIHTGESVREVKIQGENFVAETEQGEYRARKLILACGGKANQKLGSNGSGYEMAKKFGHHIIPVVPALTALKTKNSTLKFAAGVRCGVELCLKIDGKRRVSERGELQITEYGISGIPVFQVSRFAARALSERRKVRVEIDFFPDWTGDQLEKELWEIRSFCKNKTVEQWLGGVLNQKLVFALLREKGFSPSQTCDRITKDFVSILVKRIKQFEVEIEGVNEFEKAQVCAGGVDLQEITGNFESKLVKNLYLVGEVLDVDGICGGYNLQWAFASGYLSSHRKKLGDTAAQKRRGAVREIQDTIKRGTKYQTVRRREGKRGRRK